MFIERRGNTSGKNVTQEVAKKSLCIDIKRMWSCDKYDHSGNMWSHRRSNKRLETSLDAVPKKDLTDSLQRRAVLGTSHVIRKVLLSESRSLSQRGESALVQEKYRGEKACGKKRQSNSNNNNLLIEIN